MLREAVIILPDGIGFMFHSAHNGLKGDLLKEYGGYTVHVASGAWRDGSGTVHNDNNRVFTVACEDSKALIEMAKRAGQRCNQQCVYVRHCDGQVELVQTRDNDNERVAA
jgi:hypothetical protein